MEEALNKLIHEANKIEDSILLNVQGRLKPEQRLQLAIMYSMIEFTAINLGFTEYEGYARKQHNRLNEICPS